jgi:glycosyltransferase involved in cell wall biosynthesis
LTATESHNSDRRGFTGFHADPVVTDALSLLGDMEVFTPDSPVLIPDPIMAAVAVSVVIPTLNEAENLPHVFDRIPREIHELIIVDGNSTDNTIDVASRLWPGVKIVRQDGTGKGNALACGFAACSGDVIVMLDADGSTDPAEMPRYVAALLAGADFAKGTRFIQGGGSSDLTRIRRLGNWALCAVVNKLWGVKFTDLCYGYNAFWRHALRAINPDCNGFEVETHINIRAARNRLKIHEVPSFEDNRRHGASNLNARKDGMRVLRTIIAERIRPN